MAGREKKPAPSKKQPSSPVPTGRETAVAAAAAAAAAELADAGLREQKVLDAAAEAAEMAAAAAAQPPSSPVKKKQQPLTPQKTATASAASSTKSVKKPQFKPRIRQKQLRLAKTLFKSKTALLDNAVIIKNGIRAKRKPKAAADKPLKKAPAVKKIKGRRAAASPTPPSTPVAAPAQTPPPANTDSPKKAKEKVETLDDVINDLAEQLEMSEDKKPSPKATKKSSPKTEEVVESLEEMLAEVSEVVQPTEPVTEATRSPARTRILARSSGAGGSGGKAKKQLVSAVADDAEAVKVISQLDLNVKKVVLRRNPIKSKRRHSFDKVPDREEQPQQQQQQQPQQQVVVAVVPSVLNVPSRSASPRSKSAVRKSTEGASSRRSSPYTTRSDTPARILRNGKHRKLKDLSLLDGVESASQQRSTKRRRLCSELSGSEISKNSGYQSETDSNLSDVASLQENGLSDVSDTVQKLADAKVKPEPDSAEAPAVVKRSRSTETPGAASLAEEQSLEPKAKSEGSTPIGASFEDLKPAPLSIKSERDEVALTPEEAAAKASVSPSAKVPEKSLILDKMKEMFNDPPAEETNKRRKTRSTVKKALKLSDEKKISIMNVNTFYGATDKAVTPASAPAAALDAGIQVAEPAPEAVLEPLAQAGVSVKEEQPQPPPPPQQQQQESKSDVEDVLMTFLENNSSVSIIKRVKHESVGDTKLKDPAGRSETQLEPANSFESLLNNNLSGSTVVEIIETPENQRKKENILNALGLRSLKSVQGAEGDSRPAEDKQRQHQQANNSAKFDSNYTGTLKAVIKINRSSNDRKRKGHLKMTFHKSKSRKDFIETDNNNGAEMSGNGRGESGKEGGNGHSWRGCGSQSSDTAGANRKSHYSNRSNLDVSSEHTSDVDAAGQDGESSTTKSLVIPEKASSFSIHPGRLCKDECCYCFGKFGLFDTPCHIAQIKSVERQNKILGSEKHLTVDSCLCDACFRHVDRKSNTPSLVSKSKLMENPFARSGNCCLALGCHKPSSNIVKRRWLLKMRKNINSLIKIDLDYPGVHSYTLCPEHFGAIEHLMTCNLCKRRLIRNQTYQLGPEYSRINSHLKQEGIPIRLPDKPTVCKLCKYFSSLLIKPHNFTQDSFFGKYKERILQGCSTASEPARDQAKKPNKRTRMSARSLKAAEAADRSEEDAQPPVLEPQVPSKGSKGRVPSTDRLSSSPPDSLIDFEMLAPSLTLQYKEDAPGKVSKGPKLSTELTKILKGGIASSSSASSANSASLVEQLGSNPSISVRQLFPGEEDLPLQASIEFNNVVDKTSEGWEKCVCTIQYDTDTKHLWEELQKPYGNQSSFLRHLILLEKYFRNGDLTLSSNASHHATNYSESVQNRLRAYDNIPSHGGYQIQPLAMIPFNGAGGRKMTFQNAANIPKNIPISLQQLGGAAAAAVAAAHLVGPMQPAVRASKSTPPPGLISLSAGRPFGKVQQKLKVPVSGKGSWRPTLIPITQTTKHRGTLPQGLVQVTSGGKPYHITVQDYNRMCAIKRNNQTKAGGSKSKSSSAAASLAVASTSVTLTTTSPAAVNSSNGGASILKTNVSRSKQQKLSQKQQQKEAAKGGNGSDTEAKTASVPVPLPKIPKSLTVIPQIVPRRSSASPKT